MGITHTDVLIVGGGIIGSSIAYYLSQNNAEVCLVDKNEPLCGASGACNGFVLMQSKHPGWHLHMAMASARIYENLSRELGADLEYEKKGSLVIIENNRQLEERKKIIIQQRADKLDVRLLTAYQALGLEPRLSQDIFGAVYSPEDSQINPLRTAYAYLARAKEKGARVIPGCEVMSFKIKKTKAEEALTTSGRIKFNKVINAAGINSAAIAAMAGITLPVQPCRGQVLVTEAVDPVLSKVIVCGCYLEARINGATLFGATIEQTKNGNILIGASREAGIDQKTVTITGINTIAGHAVKLVPMLAQLKIIRAFAGIRPYNPAGEPFLGRVEAVDNFINACGHNGDGVTLAPITGKLISDLILNNRPEINQDLAMPEKVDEHGRKA